MNILSLVEIEKVEGKTDNKVANSSTSNQAKIASNEKVYEAEFTTAEQIIYEWLSKHQLVATSVGNDLFTDAPAPIKHSLTHFHWYLTPQQLTLDAKQARQLTKLLQMAEVNLNWLNKDNAQETLGLPRAMEKIIEV